MSPHDDEHRTRGKQREQHRDEQRSWPSPQHVKAPPTSRSSKMMHHPAFRIGEIKHGKS